MTMIKRSLAVAALVTFFAAGAQAQNFPNIRGAQDSLQDAMAQLDRAPPRFGGHKARAMRLIREAHNELDRAMAFASERRQ